MKALRAAVEGLLRTPEEVRDWQPASYAKAQSVAEARQRANAFKREQDRADWRNGQLKYQVAALAARKPEAEQERKPVLAWTRHA